MRNFVAVFVVIVGVDVALRIRVNLLKIYTYIYISVASSSLQWAIGGGRLFGQFKFLRFFVYIQALIHIYTYISQKSV